MTGFPITGLLHQQQIGRCQVWVQGDRIIVHISMTMKKRGGQKEIILLSGIKSVNTLAKRALAHGMTNGSKRQYDVVTGMSTLSEQLAERSHKW